MRFPNSRPADLLPYAVAAVCMLAPSVIPAERGRLVARAPTRGGEVGQPNPSTWVEREAYLMGTRFRLRLEAPSRAAGLRASESAIEAVRRVESLLSTWRSDSDLSRLNRSPVGEATPLPPRLVEILGEVLAWSSETKGAFDPRSGALVDAWGLRGDGRAVPDPGVAAALQATGPAAFTLSTGDRAATRHHRSAWIDAGGFGKGLALREAASALRKDGIENGILDFGGQILTLGPDGGSSGRGSGGQARTDWRISVAHPSDRFRAAATLRVGAASVSTSGGSERFVVRDGEVLSHVVDPRTGRPVPPWGSVTVIADDPLVADVVSTALFVLGPDEGMAWARERSDVGVLILSTEGTPARWNATMEPFLAESFAGESLLEGFFRTDRPGDAEDGTPGSGAGEGP